VGSERGGEEVERKKRIYFLLTPLPLLPYLSDLATGV